MDNKFKVDPAKVDARISAHESEAANLELVADALEELADDKRREASRLRDQNVALRATACLYGYPGATA